MGELSSLFPDVPSWEGYAEKSKQVNGGNGHQSKIEPNEKSELQAYCHCKGVQFKITRPSKASKELSAPYADLILSEAVDDTLDNEQDDKWWIRANRTKYLAGTCACNSCRLASGFDIQMWAFIPKVNMSQLNGDALDFDMGSLKQYNSSKGTYRDFCSRCGATVFWHDETRPDLIDVSVGLLDAAEGSRYGRKIGWHG